MKHIIFLSLSVFLFSSCFSWTSNNSDIEKAKERLLSPQDESIQWSESEKTEETPSELPSNIDADVQLWVIDEDATFFELEPIDIEKVYAFLPKSVEYGEPLRIGEKSFTYNQLKGLEIEQEILPTDFTCEGITDFLTERLKTWYFWNSCRDIIKERWISFQVIRISGEEYIYEKHYLDLIHGLYAVFELERWIGVDKEMLPEKNQELREKEFPVLEVVDKLMRDIVQS